MQRFIIIIYCRRNNDKSYSTSDTCNVVMRRCYYVASKNTPLFIQTANHLTNVFTSLNIQIKLMYIEIKFLALALSHSGSAKDIVVK